MKFKVKVAIISLSSLAIMTGALMSPALNSIQTAFPESSRILIQMIMSLPAIFIIAFNLITGKLSQIYSNKLLAIIGLILYLIGGLGGYIAPNLYALLVYRSIIGIGIGIIMPLSTGLIADFFHEDERAKMMGYSAAVNNFGGIIASILGGYLASINWRYTFLVYSLAFIPLILVVLYLPNVVEDKKSYKFIFTKKIRNNVFFYFYTVLIFFTIPNYISIYIGTLGLGNSITSGYLMTILTISSLITGILFIKIFQLFQSKTRTLSVILMFISLVLLVLFKNIYIYGISMILSGISVAIVMPYIMTDSSKLVTKETRILVLGIIGSGSFLAQFISPLFVNSLQYIIPYNGANFPYIVSLSLSLPLLIYCLFKTPEYKK